MIRGSINRFRINDLAVFHDEIVLASCSAMGACSKHAFNFPFAIFRTTLHSKGARRACLHAVAARFASRGFPVGTKRRLNRRPQTALCGMERMIARSVIACAHTTLAANAKIRIERNEGVRVEHRLAFFSSPKRRMLYPNLSSNRLQLACTVLFTAEAIIGGIEPMIGKNQVHSQLTIGNQALRGSSYYHALFCYSGTGRNRSIFPLDLNHANATRRNSTAFF